MVSSYTKPDQKRSPFQKVKIWGLKRKQQRSFEITGTGLGIEYIIKTWMDSAELWKKWVRIKNYEWRSLKGGMKSNYKKTTIKFPTMFISENLWDWD